MPIVPGARLGAYEINGAIGAGGMGEVFRERDTKLNRDVAIKVLPAAAWSLLALPSDRRQADSPLRVIGGLTRGSRPDARSVRR